MFSYKCTDSWASREQNILKGGIKSFREDTVDAKL